MQSGSQCRRYQMRFGNANHPRTAASLDTFGKPRPAAWNLTSAIPRAFLNKAKHRMCLSGEYVRWKVGSKKNYPGLWPLPSGSDPAEVCVGNKAVLACTRLVNKRSLVSRCLSSDALAAGAKQQVGRRRITARPIRWSSGCSVMLPPTC